MPAKRYRPLFRLWFTRIRAADVDDEFRFHLAMRAAELERQGYSPSHAREKAIAEFGDMDDARRFCRAEDEQRMRKYRRTLWLDHVRHDVRFALRTMRRQPAFMLATVLTLGVAIGLAASIYGVVHAYLIRPLPFPGSDRLVRIIASPYRDRPFPNIPRFDGVDWTFVDSIFPARTAYKPDGFTLTGGDRPETALGMWVMPGYFTTFGLRLAAGRAFTPTEYAQRAPVAVLSDEIWSRRYGRDPAVIGRAVRIRSIDGTGDGELITVIGVMPPNVWLLNRFTDVLRPMPADGPGIARLAPGMSIREAQDRLNAGVRPRLGRVDPAWHMTVVSLQDYYSHRIRTTLTVLLAGGVFLLLIAGASVAGAQTARAAARRAELRVRTALGASRGRIFAQLLTESTVIAVAAGLLGAVLAEGTLATIGALVGEHLGTGDHGGAGVPGGAQRLSLGMQMLALTAGAGSLAGILFGLLPATSSMRSVASGESLSAFGKGLARSTASPALRRALIVAQVAFTMMLLVGAGLMLRTVLAIEGAPLGFNPDNVVKGDLVLGSSDDPSARRAAIQRLVAGLSETRGVESSALVFPHPFWAFGTPTPDVTAEGRAIRPDAVVSARQYVVTPGYFGVLAIPVERGRDFGTQHDHAATPVAIVSNALARELWGTDEAIGRRIRLGEDSVWRVVVGVVGESREPIDGLQRPDVYVPYAQSPQTFVSVLARVASDAAAGATTLQRAVGRIDQTLALANVESMADVVDRDGRRHRALASVLSTFGLLGLALAMLGLYAALAYVVSQRRREIAVRVAIGATASAVRRLVFNEGAVLVAIGLVIGGALSLGLTRLIASQLYGVTASDPGTFAGIAVVLGTSALIASIAPIRQAVRVEPAEILRGE